MKLPSKVRICRNVFYLVVYQDVIGDDPDTLGRCDPNSRTIFLKSNLGPLALLQTFIHELIHAIEFEYDEPIPHRVTYTLDQGLASILRLNGFLKSHRPRGALARTRRATKARR